MQNIDSEKIKEYIPNYEDIYSDNDWIRGDMPILIKYLEYLIIKYNKFFIEFRSMRYSILNVFINNVMFSVETIDLKFELDIIREIENKYK